MNHKLENVVLPERIKALPVDDRGFPVPYFVAIVDGKPDHRITDPNKLVACVSQGLCWVCGQPLHNDITFIVFPMCAANSITDEPPAHYECNKFSCTYCPHLSNPKAKRNTHHLPGELVRSETGIDNTGLPVQGIWTPYCNEYQIEPTSTSLLFRLATPEKVEWYYEGRLATKEEVLSNFNVRIPVLERQVDEQGKLAFDIQVNTARYIIERTAL